MEKGAKTKDRTTYQSIPETDSLGRNVFYVIALTVVAGFVEVTGYMDCEGLYASIITGNTVQPGMNFTNTDWVKFGLVGYAIALFFAACNIASLIRRHLANPVRELVIISGVLALAMQGKKIARFSGVSLKTLVVTNNIVKFSDTFTGRFISRRFLEKTGQKIPTLPEAVLPGISRLIYSIAADIAAIVNSLTQLTLLVPAIVILVVADDLGKLSARSNH